MIQVVPQMRVLLCVDPADFRKGIDGLCGICRNVLGRDPFSGYLFLFTNRAKSGIKFLIYDGQGFWLCHKRLSKGRLRWWPSSTASKEALLVTHELQALLFNVNPKHMRYEEFRPVLKP